MPFPPASRPLASTGYSPPASASPTHGAAPSPLGSPWRLRLLGSFTLERGGERVCGFGARLDEQLLAYLALQAPTAVARRDIVALFWPQIDPATALKNLSVTLFAIKKHLRAAGLASDVIDGVRQSLRLDPQLAIDVQDFLRALARASRAPNKVQRDQDLEDAIAMFGAGLLPNTKADWLLPYQERYQQLYRVAVDLLSSPNRRPQLLAELRDALPPIAWQLAGSDHPPLPIEELEAAATLLDPDLLAFCVEAGKGLLGPQAQESAQRLDPRLPEILAACNLALEHHRPDEAARLVLPIWPYWRLRSAAAAGFQLFDAILQAGHRPFGEAAALFHHATGTLAAYAGRFVEADQRLEAAIAQWQQLRDLDGVFRSLANRAISRQLQGDAAKALELYQQCLSLARALGGDDRMVQLLYDAALAAIRVPDAAIARDYLEQRLRLLQGRPHSERLIGTTLAHLAAVDLLDDDFTAAAAHVVQARAYIDSHGHDPDKILIYQLLGRIAYHHRQFSTAHEQLQSALSIARASKHAVNLGTTLGYIAVVLQAQGLTKEAEQMLGDATQVFELAADAGAVARFQAELAQLRASAAEQATQSPG